ncbi:MAG: hypothetical protein COT43_10490 [Candidatus Marinimicrobia bacterium CG08_land_8_20_14_0_20_45_22]|nr:MAG: hypothetical protein COT43_10490 [Candidatus Marinimicrobia bacterium CG08_land_8_20_14_0_20_45_22]
MKSKAVRQRFLITLGVVFGLAALCRAIQPGYSKIDRHALSAPSSVTSSIQSLSNYLVQPARSDIEKARSIFRWMTVNIRYDTEGYFSGHYGNTSAEGTLKSRKSVCAGYGNLFESLAESAGLEVVVIPGYAKGTGYVPGQVIPSESNHDWNVVKIDGRWQLIDATWGAGHLEGRTFIRAFDDHYFLTPPEEFVFDHFPEDSQWQLLDKPLSMSEFGVIPKVWSDFFRYGISFVSHSDVKIEADGETTIALECPEDVIFNNTVFSDGTELDNRFTFVQAIPGGVQIHCLFPEHGSYLLYIFAKRKNETGLYRSVVAYAVDNRSKPAGKIGFPSAYESFAANGAVLIAPMEKYLWIGRSVMFQLRVPGAAKVAVVEGDSWTHLKQVGDKFFGDVTIGTRSVRVFALFPGNKTYSGLLEYEGCVSTE